MAWENPEPLLTRERERGNKPKPGEPSMINAVPFLEHDAAGSISHCDLLGAPVPLYGAGSMHSLGNFFKEAEWALLAAWVTESK